MPTPYSEPHDSLHRWLAENRDDILVLAPTRWKLRRAVRAVNERPSSLDLAKHLDKTLIGGIEKGFDFLGYHFNREGLTAAKDTLERFVERASRLYERDCVCAVAPHALGKYVRRWACWAEVANNCRKKTDPKARRLFNLGDISYSYCHLLFTSCDEAQPRKGGEEER